MQVPLNTCGASWLSQVKVSLSLCLHPLFFFFFLSLSSIRIIILMQNALKREKKRKKNKLSELICSQKDV